MARRKGLLAELQRQHRLAQQRQARQQRAAIRAHDMAVREAQRFERDQQRASAAAARAADAERARAEQAAKLAHIAAREAQAEADNAQLAVIYDDLDNLLATTLATDDWVDLEALREPVGDLGFESPELLTPTPTPLYHALPVHPEFVPPPAPNGITAALGGNRRHAAQVAEAHHRYNALVQHWQQALAQTIAANARLRDAWRDRESARLFALADARRLHEQSVSLRQQQVRASNNHLDELIAGLQARRADAMDEYVGIVLANSIYPEAFEVSYEHCFDSSEGELQITVLAPHPDMFPTTKAFRYHKARDEVVATKLPAAEVKRRYAAAVAQTALRTAHEVFEADREEIIESIALTVAVDTVDRATGHDARVDLVRLATDRADFLPIDLARIEPLATLAHLNAAVSKNPYGLVPLTNHGVRG
ncbi:hypothetical protein [Nocardia cyriacigeorgica]|uniref:hypothetical protein n=3 Tax=Nocardia cyriacigeorgica TaxID=135487 RepID=UPI0011B00DBF|nr:hypothetical protein [Nocardia cyriacigeorgica]MBF6325904.1 hypothetical protein [Nocardia cyriacigeorgica]